MLAFLGWNPGTSQELFTLEELADAFSLERVGKAGSKFDPDKASWFQQQYLRGKEDAELASLLKAGYSDLEVVKAADEKFLAGVCGMMKERATFLADIPVEGAYFFAPPTEFDEKTTRKKWKEGSAELMIEWISEFAKIEEYTTENIEQSFKEFLEAKEMGVGAVLPLFRLLVTGKGMGPSMFSIAELLGKEETLARIEAGIKTLG